MNKLVVFLGVVFFLLGCATTKVAENVKMISFSDQPSTDESKAIGNVSGKDCTWYVAGYQLGGQPTVRTAFQNTSEQKEEYLPLIMKKKEGSKGNLSYIRNVSVTPSGFSAWIVGRTCLEVTGVGYQ